MTPANGHAIDTRLVRGRMRVVGAARNRLEREGFLEVQTPLLHHRLSGFERGAGFSTFSSSLGERLWFRAAPELYLKRLLIDGQSGGMDKLFEIAVCSRDELDEATPRESFDRPEFTLLEAYACAPDHWSLEPLLRDVINEGVERLEAEGLADATGAQAVWDRLRASGAWERRTYAELLRRVDPDFDLEELLQSASEELVQAAGSDVNRAELHAQAIEARAGDGRLRDAAMGLAYQSGELAPYLRAGPQGYWFDFVDRAFRTKVAPGLDGPMIVHGLPVESSPLAESDDGIHSLKWELYLDGVRVALGQRELMDAEAQTVRFQHLDRLRRQGYDLLPEPDETFLEDLARWPAERPVIGMGIYLDRLAGSLLGLVSGDGHGQERMLPNLYKGYTR